jgi:hypothetical protein
MHRNEKHWLTDEEVEYRTFGESLEDAVVEIRNMMPFLENAFSGIELMAVAVRAKELGFDRSRAFWPTSFPNEGGEQVQCLRPANLPDQDPVGPHPQGIAEQVADRHRPVPRC